MMSSVRSGATVTCAVAIFGLASRVVARCIPNARLETVANSGHVIAVNNPDAFRSTVTAFLDALH